MAEKNTLSILENIKKKMHKFEQKSVKTELVDDATGEFQNIASKKPLDVTNAATNKTAESPKVEANIMLDNSLGMEELNKTIEVSQKPIADVTAEILPSNNSSTASTANSGDLDFSDLDIDADDEVVPEVVKNATSANQTSNIDDLDDLDLDTLLKEEDEKRAKEQGSASTITNTAAATAVVATDNSIVENQQNDTTQTSTSAATTKQQVDATVQQSSVKNYDDLNDIDLDSLLNEVPKQEEAKPIAEAPTSAIPEPISEVKSMESATTSATQPTSELIVENQTTEQVKANDLDLESLSLEDLEMKEEKNSEIKVEELKTDIVEDVLNTNSQESLSAVKTEELEVDSASDLTLEELNLTPTEKTEEAPDIALPNTNLPEENDIINSLQSNISIMPMETKMETKTEIKKEDKNNLAIIHEETIHQTTQSIKKLIDAKNTISSVKSLAQSNNVLNELAVQLMEPKLEKWLNENLAELVEKIVQEEIKKIIPKE